MSRHFSKENIGQPGRARRDAQRHWPSEKRHRNHRETPLHTHWGGSDQGSAGVESRGGSGDTGNLLHCWQGWETGRLLWKTDGQLLTTLSRVASVTRQVYSWAYAYTRRNGRTPSTQKLAQSRRHYSQEPESGSKPQVRKLVQGQEKYVCP